MNTQKYLLPASLAATVHVALLWLLPEEHYTRTPIETPVAIGCTLTPVPIELPPEEAPAPENAPVASLLGAPAPFSLDEPLVMPATVDFPMQIETRRDDVVVNLRTIPSTIGDPNGDPLGELRARNPIFSIRSLDRVPNAKVQMPPEYPAAMRHAGVNGSVTVEFDVDTQGRVTRAEAISYSDREFAEPAVRAVRKWRFEPGRREGKLVPFRMTVPIEFGIETS